MSKCSEKSIQEAAYYLWQNNGCPAGQDEYFWSLALDQLTNCNSSIKASTSSSSKSSVAKKASTSTASKTTVKKASASKK